MNVDDLIQINIQKAAQKIEAARRERESRQEARRRGLAQRHAQKLRNLAVSAQVAPDGTPTAETPGMPPETGCAPRVGAREPGGGLFQAADGTVPDGMPGVA